MSEWWLVGLLVVITFLASVLMVYPLRRHAVLSLFLIPVIFSLVAAGYYYWGGFRAWSHFTQQNNTRELAQTMLKSIKSPQELIDKLRAKLDDSPKSAKGWYLLGRLYSNQKDPQNAAKAFAKAYHFKPDEEQFAVNYAHSLWELNQQQFNAEIRAIFLTLLKNNAKQPDALAMLAMDAYLSHAYEDAISYWQRLLTLAPKQSDEAEAIRKAIAKAQDQLTLR